MSTMQVNKSLSYGCVGEPMKLRLPLESVQANRDVVDLGGEAAATVSEEVLILSNKVAELQEEVAKSQLTIRLVNHSKKGLERNMQELLGRVQAGSERTEILVEANERLSAENQKLLEGNQVLSQQNVALKEKNNQPCPEMAALRDQAQTLSFANNALRHENQSLKLQVKNLSKTVSSQTPDGEKAVLLATIRERDTEVGSLKTLVSFKDGEMAFLTQQVAQLQARVAAFTVERVNTPNLTLSNAEEMIRAHRLHNRELMDIIQNQTTRVRALEHTLARVQGFNTFNRR